MSGQQQQNVWQARSSQQFRNSNSNNPPRGPQSRSSTASPTQTLNPTSAPTKPQDSSHPPSRNVWAKKQQQRPGSIAPQQSQQQQSNSSFNVERASALLRRESNLAPYKPAGGAALGNRNSADKMASFLALLAKQVASIEDRG